MSSESISSKSATESFEKFRSYQYSLKYYRDLKNSIDTARDEGREKGIEEGIEKGIETGKKKKAIEIAKNLLEINIPISDIAKTTGLSVHEINKLLK